MDETFDRLMATSRRCTWAFFILGLLTAGLGSVTIVLLHSEPDEVNVTSSVLGPNTLLNAYVPGDTGSGARAGQVTNMNQGANNHPRASLTITAPPALTSDDPASPQAGNLFWLDCSYLGTCISGFGTLVTGLAALMTIRLAIRCQELDSRPSARNIEALRPSEAASTVPPLPSETIYRK